MAKHLVPPFQDFMAPTVTAVRELGGSADNKTINARIFNAMKLDAETLAIRHDDRQAEAEYRAHWARTYLGLAGILVNTARATWTVSSTAPSSVDATAIVRSIRAARRAAAGRKESLEAEGLAPSVQTDVADELRRIHADLLARGAVKPPNELEAYYARFRDHFGPEVLASLDGEALLERMHGRGTRDSLVYWLEFKDDEELPDYFGGIGGGSALKFEIYRAKETGQWMTGTSTNQRVITPDEAIERARTQRGQLIACSRVIDEARRRPEIDYSKLAADLEKAAAPSCNTAWFHKYLSMLFPQVLDPFHVVSYQAFHLIKLAKVPSGSLYENARFFAAIARDVGVPMTNLGFALYERHGGTPHGYWRVGTTVGGDGPSEWPRMREGGFVAVGWDKIPSLRGFDGSKDGKAKLTAAMQSHYPNNPSAVSRQVNELTAFAATMAAGDLVVAMQGGTKVLGVGRIRGDYYFVEGDGPFPHRRPVDWLDLEPWDLFDAEGHRTTVYRFDKGRFKQPINVIAIEQRAALPLPEDESEPAPTSIDARRAHAEPTAVPPLAALAGIPARVERALERKGQAILFGPPGTGKTYWALKAAKALVARSWLGVDWEAATASGRASLDAAGAVEVCCFHPSFGYEDFIEGLRPKNVSGQLLFEPRDGVFKSVCKRAADRPDKLFVLIIDEINRGDTPRIFGELLLALEKDKRGIDVRLALTGDVLRVPSNLSLIGTMNTADRSIALLDAALRRRFAFVELMPDLEPLANAKAGDLPLALWLRHLNARVQEHLKRDARGLQIGHAYLLHDGQPVTDPARFAEILRDDIIPLLEEYYYEDFDALVEVLGPAIVKRDERRVDEALFRPGAAHLLIDALKKWYPDVYSSVESADADVEDDVDEEDEAPTSDPGAPGDSAS